MKITPFRPIPPLSEKDRSRFWNKVQKTDSCWMWQGTRRPETSHSLGYGSFSVTFESPPYGRVTGLFNAHRVAYELCRGPIPPGLQILHSCDTARCVNPDHLRAGTFEENMADKALRHRYPRGGREPGICLARPQPGPRPFVPIPKSANEKMSDEQIVEMRTRYAANSSLTTAALAREYGLCKPHVIAVVTGKSRKKSGGPISEIRKIYGAAVVVKPKSGKPARRATTEIVQSIRALYRAGEGTIYELAKRFDLYPQTISKIIRRESWAHVLDLSPTPLSIRPSHHKFTKAQVRTIRQRFAAGVSVTRLARDYGVSHGAVSMIVHWKTHVV